MEKENTHILFDGEKILISPNLGRIFDFLIGIEKETEGLLGTRHQLYSAKKTIHELLNFATHLLEKYPEEKNLKAGNFFDEDITKIAEKLEHIQITRSEMIVLFASLDTLMALNAVYDLSSVDETTIRRYLMDTKKTKKFLNDFIFTRKNPFYRDNINRFSTTSNSNLRHLRNALTHFFSVRGFVLTDQSMDEKARRIEKKIKNINCLSPIELNELIKGAFRLLLIKWNDDFIADKKLFEEKIKSVKTVVERDGAILVYDKDLNI